MISVLKFGLMREIYFVNRFFKRMITIFSRQFLNRGIQLYLQDALEISEGFFVYAKKLFVLGYHESPFLIFWTFSYHLWKKVEDISNERLSKWFSFYPISNYLEKVFWGYLKLSDILASQKKISETFVNLIKATFVKELPWVRWSDSDNLLKKIFPTSSFFIRKIKPAVWHILWSSLELHTQYLLHI